MKTDEQLKSDVIAELSWESSINADRVSVSVEEGVVTLSNHRLGTLLVWNTL